MKKIKFLCAMITAIILLPQIHTTAQSTSTTTFEQKKEKIETQKVAFLTTKMELTTDESKAFWPVYNEYETKREAIRKEYKIKFKSTTADSLTEAQAKERITADLKMEQDLLDLKEVYVEKFLAVLPASKVMLLQKSEQEFKKVLLKMLKDKPKKDVK
jgi:hypothetical protein